MHSYTRYLQAVSAIRNLKTRHAVVIKGQQISVMDSHPKTLNTQGDGRDGSVVLLLFVRALLGNMHKNTM